MLHSKVWQEVIEDWQNRISNKNYIQRDIEKTILNDLKHTSFVSVILGVRRAGKSSLMQHLAKNMKNSVYINFEDDRLANITYKDLSTMEKLTKGAEIYFLDEVHNVKHWEKWVRRHVELETFKIVVSSSNSRLLSEEYASLLTGRKKTVFLMPFSLKEVRRVKKISLEEYLRKGGFPESVITEEMLAKEYRDDILYRDIISRYRVKPKPMISLFNYILNNPGVEASKKRLKALTGLSHPTIDEYISHIESSFAVLRVERHSFSSMERMKSPPKLYPVDNGLISKQQMLGILLESAVAQKLYQTAFNSRLNLEYIKDTKTRKFEVDFYMNGTAFQVVYELNEGNAKREIGALKKVRADKKVLIAHIGYEYIDIPEEVEVITAEEFLENFPKIENKF